MKKSKLVTIKLTEEQLKELMLQLDCSYSEMDWIPRKVEVLELMKAILKQLGERCL